MRFRSTPSVSARRGLFTSNSTRIESLERRVLLSFSATLTGDNAQFTGNSSGGIGDILTFSQSGGFLVHNRFVAGDAGFASAFDFDSAVAGEQTLAASVASTVNVSTGDSSLDEVRIGGTVGAATAAASELLATFIVFNFDTAGPKVQVNDASSSTPTTYTVGDDAVKGTGINVNYFSFAGTYGSIDVLGGSGADTFEVTSSTRDPYTLNGGDPASIPGDVLNFDTQFVDGTDNGTQITQAGRQPVSYQNIETVNVLNEIADPSQLVVTNTNNYGPNSLRNAITLANFLPGPNTITFDIPGGGLQTIAPTELPFITDPVTIDGYSQPGSSPNTLASGANDAVINVRLDGSNAGGDAGAGAGLRLVRGAEGSVIRGLQITQFAGDFQVGINVQLISGTGSHIDDVVIAGNFIGTNGVDDLGNSTGVRFGARGAASRIGGTTPADRNVISGNAINIDLQSNGASVAGNLIGLNAAGTATVQDQGTGILARGGRTFENTIGGPTAAHRNVIAGHSDYGIEIGQNADDNRILGNYIGTDITGIVSAANGTGVGLTEIPRRTEIGGAAPGEGNVISGNTGAGIEISAAAVDTRILGNYIGTDAAGNAKLQNNTGIALNGTGTGIEIGGSAEGEGNVISGNEANGITQNAGTAIFRGNRIGTNAAGTAALGNGGYGMENNGGLATIGGADATERNIISGNGLSGIEVDGAPGARGVLIYGNFIGTDVTGTVDLGNNSGIRVEEDGVVVGGALPGQGNLISGNSVEGIFVTSEGSEAKILGNRIGTDVTGKLPLGNGADGVLVNGDFTAVGGVNSGEGNVIAFNGGNGVHVRIGASNSILSNSILSNALLGIELGDDDVTPNDPGDLDAGANGLINKPTINSAFTNTTGVAVTATLDAKPDTSYTVQFFASPGPDPSGFGEGKLLLGTVEVVTNSSGTVNFAAEFPIAIAAGQVVTATATTIDGTSEFSNAVTVTGNPPRLSIGDVTVTEGNGVLVSATFTITLSDAVSGPVKVDFATADGTAIAQADYLSQTGSVTFIPGETTRTVTVTVNPDAVAEGTETFVVNLSNAQIADISDGQGVGTILDGTVVPPPPVAPYFTISDVEAAEGNSGTKQFVFTVTRNGSTTGAASVQFATQNHTAGSGDYTAKTGTLSFADGEAAKTISITVKGDTKSEGDESFRIILSNPTGATIADNNGIGKILNDDGGSPPQPPTLKSLSIGDAQITEGHNGTKTLNFTITLSGAASGNVVVKYRTQNQTAGSGDYNSKTGTLTFTPGQTSKTISITIKGDTKKESDETFRVELFDNVNATILDGTGVGTIKNDD